MSQQKEPHSKEDLLTMTRRHMTPNDIIGHDFPESDMTWYDIIGHDFLDSDMTWYDMIRHDFSDCEMT